MSYIQKIKEEFLDKSMFQAWQIVDWRAYDTKSTLVHPCNLKKKLLRELIPKRFKVDEILERLPVKQKEIAKRLNIAKLPSDRPSGWLGQTALFEVLRNKGFDFKNYLDGFPYPWYRSQDEGYTLLLALGYLYYIRRFFEYQPIDLVKYLIEPITRVHLALVWASNWYTRLTANMHSVTPNYLSNKHIHQILKNLMSLQDRWGISVSRVVEWTGAPRTDAKHLVDIIRSGWLEHRYRIVSKNTGTVKIFTKSQSKWKTLPSFFSACTSLLDDKDYFISYTDVFKKDAEGKFFEMEAINTNIELYDPKEQVWKLNSSPFDSSSIDDIYSILKTGDHLVPKNDMLPTRRDILFIALLTAMNTSSHSKKKQEIMAWFTKGYGIPKSEVENGVRNVLRKNMLRNQYTHVAIMDADRESFTLTFDDKSKKVIPFLGKVLPNLPFSWLQLDRQMGYGVVFDFHPPYLSCDLRNLIESSMKDYDVNGELFVHQSWGFGQPGSILQLVPDE
ncbi:MAG: hypothetical protein ACTSW7_04880 [Candidatus Thorarchaeota archaeon]